MDLSQLILEFFEKVTTWEHDVVRESPLSLQQMHTIEIIGHHGPLTMKDLAKTMGVTTGTLTVMIDRLEKMELATRAPNPEDRRSYLIDLTEAGREHFTNHQQMHQLLTEEITGTLNETERHQFAQILTKVNHNF